MSATNATRSLVLLLGIKTAHEAYLCLLLVLVAQHAQVLHQLQALHVPAVHKALLCCLKVQLLQGMLRQQPPQARVCVVCNECAGLCILASSQQCPGLPAACHSRSKGKTYHSSKFQPSRYSHQFRLPCA